MSLFKKAAIFTDIHFGAKGNSDIHNEDCIKFIEWFIQTAKQNNCETCLFLGDYHNNRNSMNIKTMNYVIHGLELIAKNFSQTFFIPGNHDLFYKDKRDVNGIDWARHISGITIVHDWINDSDVIISPWLIGQDYKKIKKMKGKYMFGHFEIPGFLMNALVKMPDHQEINDSHFGNVEHCFTGHFHKRQTSKNITYIGNAFPLNYSDAGDDDRGMMILDWGKQPEYISWPEQPTFRTIKLSHLMDNLEIMKPKQFLKVSVDVDISFEESTLIKEQFIQDYKLRELILVPEKISLDSNATEGFFELESVDKTVVTQITNLDTNNFDKSLLLEIYHNI
jgi:DNA repair exonuclease SbcCD nuclease subunit